MVDWRNVDEALWVALYLWVVFVVLQMGELRATALVAVLVLIC